MKLKELINPQIDFALVREVHAPIRANSNDAGTDLFVPEYNDQFIADLVKKNQNRDIRYVIRTEPITNVYGVYTEPGPKKDILDIIIGPHERILIPSGIKVNIHDKNTYLRCDNKSGVANNKGLIVGSDIIDADYQGECHISVINTNDYPVTISSGQKIVQVIQHVFVNTEWNCITVEEYAKIGKSDRGEGGFGSSGLTAKDGESNTITIDNTRVDIRLT